VIQLPPGYSDPRPLGQGGFAAVWRVWSELHGCDVAFKVPFAEDDRDLARELALELHAAASLRHPNIVQVLDAGTTPDGRPFLAMEFADAGSAAALVRQPPPWTRTAPLLLGVLDGLAHAHAVGVVHRDVKAANVLLSTADDGSVLPRLADFGLAKVLAAHGWYDSTRMGAGTMLYMAPEQFDHDLSAVHPGADLYSLGVLLYLLVSGRPPWEGDGVGPLIAAKSAGRWEPLTAAPGVDPPAGVADLVDWLLAPRPALRAEMASDVREAIAGLGGPSLVPPTVADSDPFGDTAPIDTLDVDATWVVDYEDSAFRPAPGASGRVLPSSPPPEASLPEHPCTPAIAGVRPPKLAGRQGERQALWDAARAASRGPNGVAVVGATGVGRSRLTSWLCARLETIGVARPLHVRTSDEGSVADALAAALRRFMGLGRARGAVLGQRIEAWLHAHGHPPDADLDLLRRWLDPRGATEPAEPAAVMDRRIATLERMLRTASRRSLAVIRFGDSPDPGLERVARSLLRLAQARPFPLLVLLEADEDGAPEPFRPIRVGPLPDEDLLAITRDLLPDGVDGADLAERARGNPMVVVQAARLRASTAAPEADSVPAAAPLSVAEVARARLVDFATRAADPPSARALLGLIALLPRPVPRGLLVAASRALDGAPLTPTVVEAARRSGLVRVGRWGGLDLAEAAFAVAATELADQHGEGPSLRRAAAEALLGPGASAPPAARAAAARLLLDAGEPERSLALSSEAASALGVHDLGAAHAAWELAGRAVDQLGIEQSDPRAVSVRLGAARAARNVGDLRTTEELLEPLHGAALDDDATRELRFLRCSIAMNKGDLQTVLALSDGADRVDLRVLRSEALRRGGDVDGAADELACGVEAADAAGDPRGALACRWRLARLYRQRGETERARAGLEAAVAQARNLGDLADEAIVLRELGHLDFVAGELPAAEASLRASLERSDRAGLRLETALTRLSLGELARRRGDLAQARRQYSAGLAVAHAYDNTGHAVIALLNLAITELEMGRLEMADRRLRALDRLAPPAEEHAYRPYVEALRAAVRAEQARWDEVEAAAEVLHADPERLHGQPDALDLLTRAGQRAAEAGQAALATDLWQLGLETLGEAGQEDARRDLRRRLAALASVEPAH